VSAAEEGEASRERPGREGGAVRLEHSLERNEGDSLETIIC